jgi:hypothetical protein
MIFKTRYLLGGYLVTPKLAGITTGFIPASSNKGGYSLIKYCRALMRQPSSHKAGNRKELETDF